MRLSLEEEGAVVLPGMVVVVPLGMVVIVGGKVFPVLSVAGADADDDEEGVQDCDGVVEACSALRRPLPEGPVGFMEAKVSRIQLSMTRNTADTLTQIFL